MSTPAHETVGHELPVWQTRVNHERQAQYHAAANVDGSLFGDTVDASVLANDCLHGARPRDALGAKRLHVGVRVRQSAPVLLDEALTVAARVDAIRPDWRGRYIHIGFRFERQDGSVPITIDHQSLILDPEVGAPPAKKIGLVQEAGEFSLCRTLQLTPEMVSGYSFEFPHLAAHHDPEAAAAIGMRAPIAQGLMGFTLLFQELVKTQPATQFDVEAKFKRPIFWDDALRLETREAQFFRALNSAGKSASELQIHDWK